MNINFDVNRDKMDTNLDQQFEIENGLCLGPFGKFLSHTRTVRRVPKWSEPFENQFSYGSEFPNGP